MLLLLMLACPKDGVDTGARDADGDGLDALADCDDTDDSVLGPTAWYLDGDGDGYGDASSPREACDQPPAYVANDGDCDDSDPSTHPGAAEVDCTDATDYNCDGSSGYADADGDGWPACEDCDDSVAEVNPDAQEVCNDLDDDCDGDIDQDAVDAATWYGDADGDGYGGSVFVSVECEAPHGFVDNSEDCDDLDASSWPGADEVCDEADNNCDGEVDEGVLSTFYADDDGDGYGDANSPVEACDQPTGASHLDTDCDDSDPSARPGGIELCDSVDNDCDGDVDVDAFDADEYWPDVDGDGFGAGSSVEACDQPSGYADNEDDCDDGDNAINPLATETCDGVDEDCDGTADDSAIDQETWYRDADGDGYGDSTDSQDACDQPSGYIDDDTDCDDTDGDVNPGATEECDGDDEDCDGVADNGATGTEEDCPGTDCGDFSGAGDYWVDPDSSGDAFEVYCDSSGVAWLEYDDIAAYFNFDLSNVTADYFGNYTGSLVGGNQSSTAQSGFGTSYYTDNNDNTRIDYSSGPTAPSGGWSVSYWQYGTSCSNNQIPIVFNQSYYVGDHYYLASWSTPTGHTFHTGSQNCQTGSWHHHAYVDTGSANRVFRDGSELSSSSSYGYHTMSGATLSNFGSKPGWGTNGMAGYLDDIAFFDRALSSDEVTNIYEQGLAGRPLAWQ